MLVSRTHLYDTFFDYFCNHHLGIKASHVWMLGNCLKRGENGVLNRDGNAMPLELRNNENLFNINKIHLIMVLKQITR